MKGLIITAPNSGGGKTTITLGLLRALRNRGIAIRSAKSGPDYIDPRFHEAASGETCVNLDAWSMSVARLQELAAGDAPLLIEGAMGLFDGAPPMGKGATADVARALKLPCVLICDVSKQSQSVAAVVEGFSRHAADVNVVGVILNKVGSPRHEAMLRGALEPVGLPILGAVYRDAKLETPSRHLGLVQANERNDLEEFIDYSGNIIDKSIDIDQLISLFEHIQQNTVKTTALLPPAQKIAIASDDAFAFAYPHLLESWHKAGANLSFFSPLADEAPEQADLVILPGGYPELHAGKLATNSNFMNALREASSVYGECGGYMTMGEGLIDAAGNRHEMLGLLKLETSFAKRKLHLGYRNLKPQGGLWDMPLNGHEFHYATTLKSEGQPLFHATDAEDTELPDMGLINGKYSGSFAHVIDRAD
ncbi:cobyrinate a,c-diamide synthase [Amylibacter sp. SFDW26]|uniref:cobyrinate a,c-diamide synthase n=1 Tax=Amylibacter sp. SFDW26 TaxID=2652722 RepID=UPI001262A644|nr:cobyrinate a,c-diamide synthase [Amylibacter sp. SFDW26]KAB7616117.1 cobyrinate a,c-diamide synthase [Amylibacter sp. SFDW26]